MALRFNSNVPESDVLQKYFPQHLKAALSSCGGSGELSAAPLLRVKTETVRKKQREDIPRREKASCISDSTAFGYFFPPLFRF